MPEGSAQMKDVLQHMNERLFGIVKQRKVVKREFLHYVQFYICSVGMSIIVIGLHHFRSIFLQKVTKIPS